MNLRNITIHLWPREKGDESINLTISPDNGLVVSGTDRLYANEVELVHAINELLKERRDHIVMTPP